MIADHGIVNKYDLPSVWLVVIVEFFGKFPWPGVAAFLASVYTLLRIIQMSVKWYRGRK